MISPIDIATDGYLNSPLSIYANGYLIIDVDITPVIPIVNSGGGIVGYTDKFDSDDDRKKTKITVTAQINNTIHKETIIVDYNPKLTINDVKLSVSNRDNVPKITISVKK